MEPLRFDSKQEQIGQLQAILSGLGYTIDGQETEARQAGASTIRTVRRFQREHLLSIDDNYLVDQPAALMLAKLAQQRGLTPQTPRDSGPRFTVEGTVKDRDGVPMADLEVVVYDQDLRSRQRLGASVTDGAGHYSVDYGAENFQRAEKGYADIVVQILAGRNPVTAGDGALYTSDVMFNAPVKLVHDITLVARAAPEFDRIAKSLQPLLTPEKIAPFEIEETDQFKDVSFLAGETGYSREQIADFAVAFRLAQTTTLDACLLYALLRLGVWPDHALVTVARTSELDKRAEAIHTRFGLVTATQLRDALRRADDTNIVAASTDRIEAFIMAFLDYSARAPGTRQRLGLPMNELTALVGETVEARARVTAHATEATDGFDLVRRLREDGSVPKQAVDRVEGIVNFSALSLNHAPLTAALAREINSLDDVRRLATRTSKDWEQVLDRKLADDQVPAFVAKGTATDQRAVYADFLSTRLRQAYPTMAFVGDAARDSGKNLPGTEALARVVAETPAFELAEISIDRFLDAPAMRKTRRLEEREQMAAELKQLQRLYRVTKDFGAAKALAKAGITSAQEVYRRGESAIVDIVSTGTGQSRRFAEIVYARASVVYAATLQIATESAALNSSSTTPALAGDPINGSTQLPNLSGLFQIGNDCACDDCRSVLSPAAYLADLLLYLQNRPVKNPRFAKDVLLSRRPDLSWIDLNCDNAYVPVPYVDICVAVLEDAIAPFIVAVLPAALRASLPTTSEGTVQIAVVNALAGAAPPITIANTATVSQHLTDSWVLRDSDRSWRILDRGADLAVLVLRNTHGTAAEREILPEYVNAAAYAAMSGKTFPWQLPINLYGAEISGALARIGVPRHELMRILKGPAAPNNSSDLSIAATQLGLSDAIAALLITPNPTTPFTHWGAASNNEAITRLSEVPAFLKATGLHYDDLLRLLALPFANAAGTLQIQHLDESCDLDQKRIQGLDAPALDRLHRFLRLARALGLPLADVDLMVRTPAIGAGLTTPNGLVAIAGALQVRDRLGGVAIDELVTLFGDMPTADIFDAMFMPLKPALYARLFLDPVVFRPFDPAFAVSQVTALNPPAQITGHRGPILAALRLAPEDLDKLLALINPVGGQPFVGASLSIANISALFRHVTVARALSLSIEDWCTYVRLGGADPFVSPAKALETLDRVQHATAVPLDPAALAYVLAADRKEGVAPTETDIAGALDALRAALQRVDASTDATTLPADRPGLTAAIAPALLPVDSDPLRPARVIEVMEGRFLAHAVISPAPAVLPVLGAQASGLPFTFAVDGANLVLTYTGLMPAADKAILINPLEVGAIAALPAYLTAIDELFLAPRLPIRMLRTEFSTPLAMLPTGLAVPPVLRRQFRYDAATHQLLFHGIMTPAERSQLLLLSNDLLYAAAVQALFAQPRAAVLPADNVWLSDADLAFPAPAETPAQASDRIVANLLTALTRLLPHTRTASSEDAVLAFATGVTMIDRDATSRLLRGLTIGGASLLQHFTDRPAFVLQTGPLSPANMQRAFQSYDLLHRSALIAGRMRFKLREVDFVFSTAAAAGVLGFSDLPLSFTGAATTQASLDALIGLSDLVELDKRTRGKAERLFEFITLTATQPATISVLRFAQFAEAALGWPASVVNMLVVPAAGPPAGIGITIPNQAPLATSWRRLAEAIAAIRKIGLPATDAFALTRAVPLPGDAALVRLAMRARFGTVGFASAMRPVQNALRHLKRDALTAYLLTYQEPTAPPSPTGNWDNAGDVFAYYLIDPEMNACQMTSCIVQAASTLQVFVQRAKMGLEPEVSPFIAIDARWNQWEWMKAYRLWEANRKVFLFPENWLEPGFRRNKSPAFKALQDELMQSDITDDSARDAFLNYIDKLDEVSNLDITGVHWDDGNGQGIGATHVVGRTPGQEPHVYYYRKLTHPEDRWTAWDKIELDLKNASAVPFLYEKRLHLLWPEFREEKPDTPATIPVPAGTGGGSVTSAVTLFQYGVGLSENRNGKWTPKKVSKAMRLGGVLSDDGKDRIFWFPIDFLKSPPNTFYLIDSFYGKNQAMEFLGCRGYPEKTIDRPVIYKTVFDRSTLLTARDIENEGDGELIATGNWTYNNTHILKVTPGNFKITYPHHVTTYDSIGSFAWAAILMMLGSVHAFVERPRQTWGVTTGTRSPWIYGDKTRNFYVEPISVAPDGRQYNGSQLLDLVAAEFAKVKPENFLSTLLFIDSALVNDPRLRLRWSIFYHPLVCDFRGALLNGGVEGLMARKTQFLSKPLDFAATYQPHPIVLPAYPKEDVDFSDRGAYSLYNWELFFHSAFLIATQLSKNLRFEEAMKWFHYVFDPTGGDGIDPVTGLQLADNDARRFWITRPFFEHTAADYRSQRIDKILHLLASDPNDPLVDKAAIEELVRKVASWRANPFDAHLVASGRTVAYQKATMTKYIENLMAWGDSLFVNNALEKVLEAGSIYRYAKSIMGDKPELVPPVGKPPIKTFAEIEHFDAFGNTLVQLEDLLPVLPPVGPPQNAPQLPSMLYFCIPQNEKLLALWDLVDDRLDKFHRCLDLQGRPRATSLFAPPIDPAQIMQALMGGAGLGDLLSDLDMPLSPYRFQTYLQKANELAGDLKSFGGALLAALEKRDGEALSLLRQSHEIEMLNASRDIKAALIRDAGFALANLQIAQEMATIRNRFYATREFMNGGESAAIGLTGASLVVQVAAMIADTLGGVLAAIPDFNVGASGFGGTPHLAVKTGGASFSKAAEMAAKALTQSVGIIDKSAGMISTIAGYQRRFEDWQMQKDVTALEINQYAAQIDGARIKVENATRELANHDLQTANAKSIDEFLRMKYTNGELYYWMIGEISKTYLASYRLAYAYAKMAEQHYRFEHGLDTSDIVRFDAWDSLKKGLMSGERLQFDLRQLENAYLTDNRRDFELTKHIPIATAAPSALLALRRSGRCEIELPEELFDLDYPGHYFRRIKSVSLSIPCVTGPNTTIACTLRLVRSSVRVTTRVLPGPNGYTRKMQNGIPLDDDRFREMRTPVSSIATSSAQNDAGLFELNFRDERYLPFEGAGVLSRWVIELQTDGALRTFDYDAIADVILHIRYTAREDQGGFKTAAIDNVKNQLKALSSRLELRRIFRISQDFAAAWTSFRNPSPGAAPTLTVTLNRERFTLLSFDGKLKLREVQISGHLGAAVSSVPSLELEIGVPPLPSAPGAQVVALSEDPDDDHYFAVANPVSFGPTVLAGSVDWSFRVREAGGTFEQFDPTLIDELYLIVSYVLE